MDSTNSHLLAKGDVVQIDPAQETFGGCYAQVDSVESWGVKGHVLGPQFNDQPGVMHVRLEWKTIGLVGRACWVRE